MDRATLVNEEHQLPQPVGPPAPWSPAQPAAAADDELALLALDALGAEVGLIDGEGVLLSANRPWRQAAARTGLGGGVARGDNYLVALEHTRGDERCHALSLAAGIRQVLAGERAHFSYDQPADVARGGRCYRFKVTGAGQPGCATLAREDVTDQHRGDLMLALEVSLARSLAGARDTAAGLRGMIRGLCQTHGWDCGRYFRLDAAAATLRFLEGWGIATPRVQRFLEQSRELAFHLSAGLQGRVCRSGQPLWVVAGSQRPDLASVALAPETDQDGALIFPVTWQDEPLGVLAFSGRGVAEPDDRMLQVVRAIGAHAGSFLHGRRELEEAQRAELRYRRLTQLASDWTWELDREFRFTDHAGLVELATGPRLGKALWEIEGLEPRSSAWTEYRAQLQERWSFSDFEFACTRLDGRPAFYSISGEPIFDDAGGFLGYWGTGMDVTRRRRRSTGPRSVPAAT